MGKCKTGLGTIKDYYGITVYRIFGKKKDLEGLGEQSNNQTILLDPSEKNKKGFINFNSLESIDTGILTEVWSYKELPEIKYYYDSFQVGYKIIRLKRGDIIEFICAHRILIYFKVMAGGLKRITINQSMIKKNIY